MLDMGRELMEPDTPDAWTTDDSAQLMNVTELLGVAVRLTSVGDAVSEAGVDVAVAVDVGVGEGRARDAPAPAACRRLTSSALSARVWTATSRMKPLAGSAAP